ncbi:O-antigen ligase domain-containing protein [Lutimaribacter marinistellae]|uniref:O-antigen ligase domain-containing protein n=1 Tax=Lutimaribacter marinistellae TaxID=1820329 RepID=A0ABV7TEE1_9RHOB
MKILPQNPAERIVWYTLTLTWVFYAFGALYVVGPVLAWVLAGLVGLSLYLAPIIRPDLRPTGPIPLLIWLWIAGMVVMLVALWIGHLDWGLGTKKTIKSSIGWAKGWALLALFPLAGAMLPIRRRLLVRAQCVVGLWTLLLAPVMLAAPYVGLPESIFTSPLKAVGGPGPEYFTVYFFTMDPASWTPRWQFYAPWSPFAALLGVIMVLFALEEEHRGWMAAGLVAGLLMILASKSRMGLVGLVGCTIAPRMLPLIARSWAWITFSGLAASFAVWGVAALEAGKAGIEGFKSARADSTRVRATLQRIAWERWESDAVWFGHGTVQPGPHLVEYMPIGSHHTWYGLLFVKGLTGFLAFLVPLVVHLGVVVKDAVHHPRGRLPLGILMTMVLLSFGENIEIEAYLLWPALIVLGCHLREMAQPKPSSATQSALPVAS